MRQNISNKQICFTHHLNSIKGTIKLTQLSHFVQDLAESLFNGDLPIGDFLTSFKEKRTLAHMRRIKSEKMRELLLQMQREETANIPAVPPRFLSLVVI